MLTPKEREELARRWREINHQLEEIEDLPEDEHRPVEQETALQEEMREIEERLGPEYVERQRREGRGEGD